MNRKQRRQQEKAGKKQQLTGKKTHATPAASSGGVASALMGYAGGGSAVPLATGGDDPQKILQFAVSMFQNGRLVEAERAFRDVLLRQPANAPALQLLGVTYHQMGKADEATACLTQAIEIEPDYAEAHHNFGLIWSERGDNSNAQECFRAAIAAKPDYADAHLNLGNMLAASGELAAAREAFKAAIEHAPENTNTYGNLASLELSAGHYPAALSAIEAALDFAPKEAALYTIQGSIHVAAGDHEAARSAFQQVLSLDPTHKDAISNLQEINSRLLPGWHFPMLVDDLRNDAYDEAIRRAVKPGDHVLDIGAGSGLLAMMAARAGAAQVTAAERIPELAHVAQRIADANGYGDRLKVVAKLSSDMEMGEDLQQPVDLIVSEILDAALLGEGVMPSLRHAVANFAQPGVRMLPQGATVMGAIMELPDMRRYNPLGQVNGFDLSIMNEFRNALAYRSLKLADESHRQLSEPFHVATFDFANLPTTDRHRVVDVPITDDGEMHAVVFWFDLHLDDQITVSSRAGGELKHWGQAVQYFDHGPQVSAGENLPLTIAHTDTRIFFDLVS